MKKDNFSLAIHKNHLVYLQSQGNMLEDNFMEERILNKHNKTNKIYVYKYVEREREMERERERERIKTATDSVMHVG